METLSKKKPHAVLDYVNAVLNYNYVENKLSCLAQNVAPAHDPVPSIYWL